MPLFPRPRAASVTDADRVRLALDTHYDAIWRFLRRLGVPQSDCEDAAQKVFIVFAERVAGVNAKAERSFLFSSALRVASDARKKKSHTHELLAKDGDAVDATDPAHVGR